MSAADRIRTKGRNLAQRAADTGRAEDQAADDQAPAPAAQTPAPAAPSTVRTERIRRSVDLPPQRHYALEEWCLEASRERGHKVTGMAVMNALVAQLLTDETLARKIAAHPELTPEPRRRRSGRK